MMQMDIGIGGRHSDMERLYNSLVGIAMTILRSKADAEDVVNTSIVEMLDMPAGKVITDSWAKTYTRNRALNFVRTSKRRLRINRGFLDATHSNNEPTVEDRLIREDEISELLLAMDDLPDNMYYVLYLRFFQTPDQLMRIREIADRLGLARSTVSDLLVRGINTLRERLGGR